MVHHIVAISSHPPPTLPHSTLSACLSRVVFCFNVLPVMFPPPSHPEWGQEGARMKALAVGIEDALNKNFVSVGEGEMRGRTRKYDKIGVFRSA